MNGDRRKTINFINSANWIYAKTMPHNPHEYCLRRDTDEAGFEEFVMLIRKEGYEELYEGKMYTCYNVGKHKYWTMGAPLEETILINRKTI